MIEIISSYINQTSKTWKYADSFCLNFLKVIYSKVAKMQIAPFCARPTIGSYQNTYYTITLSQDICPGLRYDHSLVTLSLKIRCSQQNGRGFFKFNTELIKDTEYVKGVKNITVNFILEQHEGNLGLLWDALNSEIRGFSIGYK